MTAQPQLGRELLFKYTVELKLAINTAMRLDAGWRWRRNRDHDVSLCNRLTCWPEVLDWWNESNFTL